MERGREIDEDTVFLEMGRGKKKVKMVCLRMCARGGNAWRALVTILENQVTTISQKKGYYGNLK